MGGLAIGVLLLVVPEVAGRRYDSVDQALNGGMLAGTMAVLLAAKLMGTTISYASGNAGGIFAPSLYIGAMVGGIVGTAVHRLAPFPTGDTGAYALVGMGALFAGIIRAPMTSVFMIFEITQDYQILVPLMVANLIAFWISRRYQPTGLHALLLRDGVHLPSGRGESAGPRPTARICYTGLPIVDADTTLEQAWGLLDTSGASAVLVSGRDGLNGVVARHQLEAARDTGGWTGAIGLLTGDVGLTPSGHPIDVVLERLAEARGVLPIVSRSDVRRVEAP
jgi:CIC family chloride channel protein